MDDIQIITEVSGIPPARTGRPALYPFAALEVGQSFYVPALRGQASADKLVARVSSAKKRYEKSNPGAKFSVRRGSGNQNGSVTVWRTR